MARDPLPAASADRARIESLLGEPVIEARSQPGGYSPGSADRVRTASGRRAFGKSAGLAVNPDTPRIHRTEAAVTAVLPPNVPAPALIGSVEHDDWVALVLEDVEARHPSTPWKPRELTAVFDALHEMASAPLAAAQVLEASLVRLSRGGRLGEIFSRHTTNPMRMDTSVVHDVSGLGSRKPTFARQHCWPAGPRVRDREHHERADGLRPAFLHARRTFQVRSDHVVSPHLSHVGSVVFFETAST